VKEMKQIRILQAQLPGVIIHDIKEIQHFTVRAIYFWFPALIGQKPWENGGILGTKTLFQTQNSVRYKHEFPGPEKSKQAFREMGANYSVRRLEDPAKRPGVIEIFGVGSPILS
jgi:hypothetical protein